MEASNQVTVPWVDAERQALLKVVKRLHKDLPRLEKKRSSKRVHLARTALRHWFALWSVLREDGWERNRFKKHAIKPLGKLLKELGRVRNLDVNLKTGKALGCTDSMIDKWKRDRKAAAKRLKKYIKRIDLGYILDRIDEFALQEPIKLSAEVEHSETADQPAREHLSLVLTKQERTIKDDLNPVPNSPDEVHHLRLAIKTWRYLLEDLYGEQDDRLKNAQDKLGTIHDLDRLRNDLEDKSEENKALANLNEKRRELINDLVNLQKDLPFQYEPTNGGQPEAQVP